MKQGKEARKGKGGEEKKGGGWKVVYSDDGVFIDATLKCYCCHHEGKITTTKKESEKAKTGYRASWKSKKETPQSHPISKIPPDEQQREYKTHQYSSQDPPTTAPSSLYNFS